MQDLKTGWALSESAVLRTTDGGQQWQEVNPKDLPEPQYGLQGFFLDATTAWLLVSVSSASDTGRLYHTRDAGDTWQSIQVPFAGGDLQFLDTQNGSIMADRGVAAGSQAVDIYHTADSGQTWTLISSASPDNPQSEDRLPFAGNKSGMTFLDDSRGWVAGYVPMMGEAYLYQTQNGGKTWRYQSLTFPPGYDQASVTTYAPTFFNQQDGVLPVYLATDQPAWDFYFTHDAGNTWQATTPVAIAGPYSLPTSQDFFIWDGKTFVASHDGGQTWTQTSSNPDLSQSVHQLDFIDPMTGWATTIDPSGQNHLYITTDAGDTWQDL
jgi:photosystem II stability/assembly factor-like uncharacterized protein